MILRLTRGTTSIDLSSGMYAPAQDFLPPGVTFANSLAIGSAISSSDALLISQQPQVRTWDFGVRVLASGAAGVNGAVRQIADFIAAGEGLFVEYSPLDIPEPCYGWFGACMRYAVIAADSPTLTTVYRSANTREAGTIINLHLTIKSNAIGPARQVARATGTVTEDVTGQTSGQAIGVKVAASSGIAIPRAFTGGVSSIYAAGGALLFVWRPETASTASGNKYFFENDGGGAFDGYFNATNDKFYFVVGSNTISSSAQTFAAGDVIRLLFTWGSANKLKIYRDGVQIATGSSFTAPSEMTNLYAGSNASRANQCLGNFTLTVWPTEPTAAQVAEIDAAARALTTAGLRVDHLPWMWTDSGTTELNTYRDSDEDNRAIVAGIPGGAPAKYRAMLTHSTTGTAVMYLNCYQHPLGLGLPAKTDFYAEIAGSSETGNSAGNYGTLLTSGDSSTHPLLATVRAVAALARARLNGTAARTMYLMAKIDQLSVTGSSYTATILDAYGYYWVPPVYLTNPRDLPHSETTFSLMIFPSANIDRLDYVQYLPLGTLLKFSATSAIAGVGVLFDAAGVIRAATAAQIYGEVPQLYPGSYNVLSLVNVLAPSIDGWLVILQIAPSWGLL